MTQNIVVDRLELDRVRPNPARIGRVNLRFLAPSAGKEYTLKLYDIQGRLIATLFSGKVRTTGWQTVNWNGKDKDGTSVAPGIYFYRLESEARSLTQKAIFVR